MDETFLLRCEILVLWIHFAQFLVCIFGFAAGIMSASFQIIQRFLLGSNNFELFSHVIAVWCIFYQSRRENLKKGCWSAKNVLFTDKILVKKLITSEKGLTPRSFPSLRPQLCKASDALQYSTLSFFNLIQVSKSEMVRRMSEIGTYEISTAFSATIKFCKGFKSWLDPNTGMVELCAIFVDALLNMTVRSKASV